MTPSPILLAARLLRRLALAGFLVGCAQAVAALALALGLALLALRFAGLAAPPQAWWGVLALAVPAAGLWRARRSGWDLATASAWLDRRHGLGGLLLTGLERELAAWREPLEERLAGIPELPRLRLRPLLVRTAPALLFLAAVLSLPAVAPTAVTSNPAITQAVEDLQQRIERVLEQQVLDPRLGDQLAAELRRMTERNAAGEAVHWSELDGLAARLQSELQDSAVAASKARAQLAELAQPGAERADAGKVLADLVAQLAAAGLMAGLPKDLAAQAVAANDPKATPLTPEQARALAAALSQALAEGLDRFGELGRGDLAQLAALDPAALAALRQGQTTAGHVHTESCPGGT